MSYTIFRYTPPQSASICQSTKQLPLLAALKAYLFFRILLSSRNCQIFHCRSAHAFAVKSSLKVQTKSLHKISCSKCNKIPGDDENLTKPEELCMENYRGCLMLAPAKPNRLLAQSHWQPNQYLIAFCHSVVMGNFWIKT